MLIGDTKIEQIKTQKEVQMYKTKCMSLQKKVDDLKSQIIDSPDIIPTVKRSKFTLRKMS